MADQLFQSPSVELLASTADLDAGPDPDASFFKSAQWSADGTTLFTSSSANTIGSYVVPTDLLHPRDGPLSLRPQGSISLPEPTHAIAPCPYFSLSNPYTHVILTAAVDHPIQLHQAFPPALDNLAPSPPPYSSSSPSSPSPLNSRSPPAPQSPPIATYPLIHAPTEAYLPSLSLLWPAPGTHFLAGTKNLIAYFDLERSRSGADAAPLLSIPTIPSTRHLSKGGGVGMRGAVSALAAHPDPSSGPVAAGTWTRWVGLYDLHRAGAAVANWSVAGAADGGGGGRGGGGGGGVGGHGVMQTAWSPCGRYLVVNERKSSGLLVYDVRGAGKLLGWLGGRDADTHQRMTCDVFPSSLEGGGFEVWAGSRTGSVMVWEEVGMREGCVPSSWDWQAHGSSVGSTAMHSSGSVVATCSGSWKIHEDEDRGDAGDGSGSSSSSNESDGSGDSDSSHSSDSISETGDKKSRQPRLMVEESSLKIWGIGSNQPKEARDEPA